MAITNIYKGDVERSDIQKIYKGSTLLYEKVSTPKGETWVINESISNSIINFNISFISNNQTFTRLESFTSPMGFELNYRFTDSPDLVAVYANNSWTNQAYRTITFETAPTGALLTWLEANAVKQ